MRLSTSFSCRRTLELDTVKEIFSVEMFAVTEAVLLVFLLLALMVMKKKTDELQRLRPQQQLDEYKIAGVVSP